MAAVNRSSSVYESKTLHSFDIMVDTSHTLLMRGNFLELSQAMERGVRVSGLVF